jgi:hypothetical protein
LRQEGNPFSIAFAVADDDLSITKIDVFTAKAKAFPQVKADAIE